MERTIKALTRKFLPLETRVRILDFRFHMFQIERKLAPYLLAGRGVTCPCCNSRFRRFSHFGRPLRKNAMCPRCLALERHRLVWLYLMRQGRVLQEPLRLLHVAPEASLRRVLQKQPNLKYTTIDLHAPGVDAHMDLLKLALRDNSFDVVVCNHVLEHVRDDRQAMREIRRVLVPNGMAILQVPFGRGFSKTAEDPTVTSPEERRRLFGQEDHVRLYGPDYVDRLQGEGFRVTLRRCTDDLSEAEVKEYGIDREEILHVCFKPV